METLSFAEERQIYAMKGIVDAISGILSTTPKERCALTKNNIAEVRDLARALVVLADNVTI